MASTSTLLQALFQLNPHRQHLSISTQTPQKNHLPNSLLFHNTFPTRKHNQKFLLSSINCTVSESSEPTGPEPAPTTLGPDSTWPEPPDPLFPGPSPEHINTTSADEFPIERRRKSVITRERNPGLVKPEPPNFEIGWKRTKVINLEKPKGWVIADFLEKLETLMGMEYGSTELLAKTGEIVAERAREEAEVLVEKGDVDDRMVTELHRVLRLLEMDLAMVKASAKEETLKERLEQAKARCRQAILVALSF